MYPDRNALFKGARIDQPSGIIVPVLNIYLSAVVNVSSGHFAVVIQQCDQQASPLVILLVIAVQLVVTVVTLNMPASVGIKVKSLSLFHS